MECEIGSKAFIIESNRILREVTIVRKNSDFYIVRFDNNGSIQLCKSRVFPTREAAEQHLLKKNPHLRHLGVNHRISLGIKR